MLGRHPCARLALRHPVRLEMRNLPVASDERDDAHLTTRIDFRLHRRVEPGKPVGGHAYRFGLGERQRLRDGNLGEAHQQCWNE